MQINAMVVDDSGIMRKMVMRSLVDANLAEFTFTEAGDGAEALEKFDPKTVDMVFLDWNMPRMSGIEFVKHVRGTLKQEVPIVMITTEGTIGKMEEAMNEAKVNRYIAKPFTVEQLQKKLQPLFEELGQRKKPGGFFGRLASKLA